MPYRDGKREMSENARIAYRNGLFPLSKVTKDMLVKKGFYYPLTFFIWLCKNDFIVPSEHHHTSASFRLTAFYSPKAIIFATHSLRLDNLYHLYRGKTTEDLLIRRENVKYVRICVSSNFFGLKKGKDAILDCVRFKKFLIYSEESIIGTKSSSINIIEEYDKMPHDWSNINTNKILRRIMTRKKISWKNVIGNIR